MADFTDEEYGKLVGKHFKKNQTHPIVGAKSIFLPVDNLPKRINWRDKAAVRVPRN